MPLSEIEREAPPLIGSAEAWFLRRFIMRDRYEAWVKNHQKSMVREGKD